MVARMSHDHDAPEALNLAERIRRLANGRNTIDVAQFQFIGLEEIRQRYGVRWNDKRERVQGIARHFISKRIAPEDVLIPGADGFLVVFGSRAGILADTAAQRISKELNTFFVGCETEDSDIQLKSRHASMSVDDFAQAFGDLIAESAPARTLRSKSRSTSIGKTCAPVATGAFAACTMKPSPVPSFV